MGKLKTYTISTTTASGNVNITKLTSEVDADGSVTDFDGIEVDIDDDEVHVLGDSINDVPSLDAVLAAHNGVPLSGSTISPATLTADVNDYNPDDFHDADTIILDSDSDTRKITGFDAGIDGEEKELIVTRNKSIKLTDEDALSLASNRILCPDMSDYTLQKGSITVIRYSEDDLRWRVLR